VSSQVDRERSRDLKNDGEGDPAQVESASSQPASNLVFPCLSIFVSLVESVALPAKAGFASSSETGKGRCKISGRNIRHGYHLVKGKSSHPMEDYLVAEFKKVDDHELGLFAIFDGHLGHDVADYLRSHLFENILKEVTKLHFQHLL
ncbi:hypothetical protein BHE74_00043265, partial [Ensete ventricosum]